MKIIIRNKYELNIDMIIEEGQNLEKLENWKESQKVHEKAISLDPNSMET
jgi:hypothetical protein